MSTTTAIKEKTILQDAHAGVHYERASAAEIVAFLSVVLALLCIEAVGVYMYFFRHTSLSVIVILHVIASLIAIGCSVLALTERSDLKLWIFLGMMITVAGPLGAVTCGIAGVLYGYHMRSSVAFEEWFASMFPQEQTRESGHLYERIIFGLDDIIDTGNVEPFRDIMTYGAFQQKQDVLIKITRYFRPEFAPVLLQALEDRDNAIRVQAAGAIADIEREYLERYIAMERLISKDASDVTRLQKFAALCDEYAHCGILDKEREQQSRNRAIELYETCHEARKDDMAIVLPLGRLYLLNHEPAKAVNVLKPHVERDIPEQERVRICYMEALFENGDLQSLRTLAKRYSIEAKEDQTMLQEHILTLNRFWQNRTDHALFQAGAVA
ncbi:MAG: hypothetical protein H6908_02630 [Hyphomicrobiales bacterium]|nr:hypothetical protein [Rickettsiales bacterium]MCP5361528.1 hypothetical protein [Hyphomicrobiales bacterium]